MRETAFERESQSQGGVKNFAARRMGASMKHFPKTAPPGQ
jgi:hypothetical protein